MKNFHSIIRKYFKLVYAKYLYALFTEKASSLGADLTDFGLDSP